LQHTTGTYAAQQQKQQQQKQQHVGMPLVTFIISNALTADKCICTCSLSLTGTACAR
jgi:hypothetical protein